MVDMDASEPFTKFVNEHGDSLFRTAVLLTGRSDEAEELVQDTLVRLYPKWSQVAAAELPVAYVRRALINGFLSNRRRASSRDLPAWELPDRPDSYDMAATVVEREALLALLAALPARQRAALVLRFLHDMPDAEIGAVLSCRPGAVRTLVSRALSTLRKDTTGGDSATAPARIRGNLS